MRSQPFFCLLGAACMLLAAGCASLGTGGDVPAAVPEPAEGVTLVPELQPTTSEDIGRRFEKVEDSSAVASVSMAEDGRPFIYLPVNFKEGAHRRVAWDIKVKADWRDAKSIVFDFMSGKDQYVAGLCVYFHSENGWYSGSFGLDQIGQWTRVELGKSDMGVEDAPVGWHQIDTVRISTWRHDVDQDGWFALANFGVRKEVPGQTQTLVIRGDSCAKRDKSEAKGFTRFANTMMESLVDAGIDVAIRSDEEITAQGLRGYKLVVLPYNPTMPPVLTAALKDFVARGGKIIGCYNLPRDIQKLMGVSMDPTGYKRKPKGRLGGFRATAKALNNQPAMVKQSSYSTCIAKPDCGRVVATWSAENGKDTGIPAIIKVKHGFYLGHVWLESRGAGRTKLMEAMVNEFLPIDRVGRVRKELDALGRQDGTGDWKKLTAKVEESGKADASRSLAEASRLRQQASALLDKKDWRGAASLVAQARLAAKKAYFLTLPSAKGEERLFWCHDASGIPGWSWDQAVKYLADCGFTAVIPNMCWGGVAYYDSKVLPRYAKYDKDGDRIVQCLAACKKYGLKCHVWKVCFNMSGHASPEFRAKMDQEGRVQVSRNGEKNTRWLCPTNPLNQQLEIDTMVELAQKYPQLDGVHFDYIRFSNSDVCFCEGCRKRFEARLGRKLTVWPFKKGDAALQAEWEAFRRDAITHVVKTVHEKVKALRPDMKISAALFSDWKGCRRSVGQDWELWCRKGWLDFACPMDYKEEDTTFQVLIKEQLDLRHDVPLYPGIGISCWKNPNPYRFARQIDIVRKQGLTGFTVFNYDHLVIDAMKWLKLGCTKEK